MQDKHVRIEDHNYPLRNAADYRAAREALERVEQGHAIVYRGSTPTQQRVRRIEAGYHIGWPALIRVVVEPTANGKGWHAYKLVDGRCRGCGTSYADPSMAVAMLREAKRPKVYVF